MAELPWTKAAEGVVNAEQRAAVEAVVGGKHAAAGLPFVIFGPPGTGKTLTVVEGIMQVSVNAAGLPQKLSQLEAVNRGLHPKSWANLQLLGQSVTFARSVSVLQFGLCVWCARHASLHDAAASDRYTIPLVQVEFSMG